MARVRRGILRLRPVPRSGDRVRAWDGARLGAGSLHAPLELPASAASARPPERCGCDAAAPFDIGKLFGRGVAAGSVCPLPRVHAGARERSRAAEPVTGTLPRFPRNSGVILRSLVLSALVL